MDPGVITASAGLIGSVVTLLTVVGGGLAFLIRRADKKRESGESLMLEYLKGQLRKSEARNRWLEEVNEIRLKDGNSWRDQLLRADLEPKPEGWTPLPPPPPEDAQ